MHVEQGDIVQVRGDLGPDKWAACLVVVTEVRPWGIQGYTTIPRGGNAFIRLKYEDIEQTRGRVVWALPRDEEESVP